MTSTNDNIRISLIEKYLYTKDNMTSIGLIALLSKDDISSQVMPNYDRKGHYLVNTDEQNNARRVDNFRKILAKFLENPTAGKNALLVMTDEIKKRFANYYFPNEIEMNRRVVQMKTITCIWSIFVDLTPIATQVSIFELNLADTIQCKIIEIKRKENIMRINAVNERKQLAEIEKIARRIVFENTRNLHEIYVWQNELISIAELKHDTWIEIN